MTVGTFGRDASGVEQANGALFSVSGSHAAAPSRPLAYKVTAGFYHAGRARRGRAG